MKYLGHYIVRRVLGAVAVVIVLAILYGVARAVGVNL